MPESPVQFLGWEDPLEKGKATHPVFWPGEFHRLYSSRGRKELNVTERLFTLLMTRLKRGFLSLPCHLFQIYFPLPI